jgi:hypothetical protein
MYGSTDLQKYRSKNYKSTKDLPQLKTKLFQVGATATAWCTADDPA